MEHGTGVSKAKAGLWAALALGAAHAAVGAGCGGSSSATSPDASPGDAAASDADASAASDASAPDSAGSNDATAMDQSSGCPAGLSSCGGSCVNTTNDPTHCGACGSACTGGLVCSAGACALSCAGGTTKCGSSCSDTHVDPANCGSCGHACGSDQLCSGGACVSTCPTGQVACGGSCIDPGTNGQYCGATSGCGADGGTAGTVCHPGQVCSGGSCALSCQAGLVECGGACVDPTTSGSHCGATSGCGADGGSAGTACGPGFACSAVDGGTPACAPSCAPPLVACSGACVDPRNDPNNCNGCAHACAATQYCSNSTCTSVCAPGTQPVVGPSGLQCVPSGLVRWYPFDGDTKDYSGSGQNLTNSGATASNDRSGNAGGAYAFDGSKSYMSAAGTGIPFGNAARTFTAWVHPTASVVTQGTSVGGFITTGTGNCSALMFAMSRAVLTGGTSTDLYFWGGCDDTDSGLSLPVDTWSFAAIAWDGAKLTQYVGAKSATATPALALATAASHLWVGIETSSDSASAPEFYFTGDLDDIRVFDRALGAAEIAQVQALP